MNLQRTLSFVLALGLPLGVALARPLTLEEAQRRALEANPRLRAKKLEIAVAKAQSAQAVGRHFGEVDFVSTYNTYNDARLVRPIAGPLNPAKMGAMPFDENQFHFGLSWQIPLLASGKLIFGDRIAKDMERMANASYAHARHELCYNVRAAYRNLLVLRHAIEAVEAYEKALEEDANAAQLKVKVEALAPVDAQKVAFALEGARAQKAGLLAQRQAAEAMLAALMGEDPPADGFTVEDLPDEPPSLPSLQDGHLLEIAKAQRQDLKAARESLMAAQHRRDQARWSFFIPELGIQGTWLGHVAPSVSGALQTFDFVVYLKFPLLIGMTRWFATRETRAEWQAKALQVRALELEIASQVTDALGRLDAAKAQFEAAIVRRKLGHEVARVEHLKFEQGSGRIEDYLSARAQEVEGEAFYWQSRYNLETAKDYLDFVIERGGEP